MALITVSNNALQNITAVPASIPTGALTLIKSITANASASISFVHGTDGVVLDGTYLSYVFKFINCHPSISSYFGFQGSTNSGSSYGVTLTSTVFEAYHGEDDSYGVLEYVTSQDLAQSTNFQKIMTGNKIDNDSGGCGTLQIFNPSSTTYVKHFINRTSAMWNTGADDYNVAGYFNTTSAINAFQFKFESGNIDDGIIKLYGVK